MRKSVVFVLSIVLLLSVFCSVTRVTRYELISGTCTSEQDIYDKLINHSALEIIKEFNYRENNGETNLISYGMALHDKEKELSTETVIKLICDRESLTEAESILVDILHKKSIDFNTIQYLQKLDTVTFNTKQLILLSNTVSDYYLEYAIKNYHDFRARSAMQELSFKNPERAFALAIELLDKQPDYYAVSAINIAFDEYFRFHGELVSPGLRKTLLSKLRSLYMSSLTEQEHYWIMDSLGWIGDWEVFKNICDGDYTEMEKRMFFLSSYQFLEDLVSKRVVDIDDSYLLYYMSFVDNDYVESYLKSKGKDKDICKIQGDSKSAFYPGYAVYRNGNGINFFYHAAIMYLPYINSTNYPVVHSTSGNTVSQATWSTFKAGNTFVGMGRPNNCNMGYYLIQDFAAKAYQLIGTAYNVQYQVYYNLLNDNSTVEPSQITSIRCDGVVEYCYEYYNYRVYGADWWNVAKNNQLNRTNHAGFNITPKSQYDYYLTHITTNESDLY